MLNALYKLGCMLPEGDELDRFYMNIEVPDPDKKYYTFGLCLDLDNKTLSADPNYLEEFDSDISTKIYKAISILSGNQRKVYLSTDAKHLPQLFTTVFNTDSDLKGDLLSRLNDYGSKFVDTLLYNILNEIFLVQNQFNFYNSYVTNVKSNNEKLSIQSFFPTISEILSITNNQQILLYYFLIKAEKLGITNFTPMADLEGYNELIKDILLPKDTDSASLCYISGKVTDSVSGADFLERKSLNKIFVTTYKNYASRFKDESFYNNYKISKLAKIKVENASAYAFDNLNIRIAGVPHLIIPEFRKDIAIDTNDLLLNVKRFNDLIFNTTEFTKFTEEIEFENKIIGNSLYWLNYFGYETDGKFFKVTNRIKDVNNFHLNNVISSFAKNGALLDKRSTYVFNLRKIYSIIPIRESDSNKNIALDIISSILEKRKIDSSILFNSAKELFLYHFLDRGKIKGQYKNVYPYSDSAKFDFNIKNAVVSYLVLFKTLLELNQLTNYNFMEGCMENNNTSTDNKSVKEEEYFNSLGYTQSQKAMFYLGRMLNKIAYKQYEKGHEKKPILQKINFNGMTFKDILKLRNELFEKARQYDATDSLAFLDSKFSSLFNFNDWKLSPNEALFFILNGYTFYISSKETTTIETVED